MEEIPALSYTTMGWPVVKPSLKPKAGTMSKELQVRMGAGFPSCRSKMQLAAFSETALQPKEPASQRDN